MDNNAGTRLSLGDDEPLITGGRSNPPDRREISARWLTGTILTGVTSTVLLGVALSAALDGREQLATPPETALIANNAAPDADDAHRTARLNPSPVLGGADTRRQLEVSTVHKEGDREVVRSLPFVHLRVPLAINYGSAVDYPPFDPLTVFAEDSVTSNLGNMGVIYGAKVESEMALRTQPFPLSEAVFDEGSQLSAEEVEQVVRDTGSILTEGNIQVASLHYVDPQRFGETLATQTIGSLGVRIVPENVSNAPRNTAEAGSRSYAEDIIIFNGGKPITQALSDAGYDGPDATGMADAISKLLNTDSLKAGVVVCLGLEVQDDRTHIMRASVFEKKQHILTIALNDRGQYVPSEHPEFSDALMAALANEPKAVSARADLPRVYDGVFSAALSHGLNRDMTRKLIRLLAADVDMQSRLSPTDKIEVFFSQPSPNGSATENSELLYVSAVFNNKDRIFYRFQLPDGTVDYFDREGRSARPFLIRNPVPAGRMTSPYGLRRHPILGYSKMHTGVDWAAPRGTPIMATGDGVVESAGWSAGYGRQTILRHANGYKTSYNHQSGIAKGIKPGATVRQGQVIGFVGATGLATGNHLHYEMFVNSSRVDPMRVRLPDSRSLEGEVLEVFKGERDRIEALLEDSFSRPVIAAATN